MLTEKEATILVLRSRGLKQADIAKALGITQGSVSRSETAARKKLQEALTDLEALRILKADHGEKPYAPDVRAKEIDKLTKRWRQ